MNTDQIVKSGLLTLLLQMALGTGGCLATTAMSGCGPLTDDQGKLDMERVAQLREQAEKTDGEAELDVRLRPGRVELTEGFAWNTGVEADLRIRWRGQPGKKDSAVVEQPDARVP